MAKLNIHMHIHTLKRELNAHELNDVARFDICHAT